MKTWWNSLSLKNKLQIPIQMIILVMLVIAQQRVFSPFEQRTLEEAHKKAVISSDGVINGLNIQQGVADVLSQSTDAVNRVSQGVDEISASVNQQKEASRDIARNLEQMAAMAEANNSTIKDTVQAVKEMEGLTASLRDAGDQFKV